MERYWVRKARLHKTVNVSCGVQLEVVTYADHRREVEGWELKVKQLQKAFDRLATDKADLRGQLEAAQGELREVDMALDRRTAFDGIPTRAGKIYKACNEAGKVEGLHTQVSQLTAERDAAIEDQYMIIPQGGDTPVSWEEAFNDTQADLTTLRGLVEAKENADGKEH